MHDVDRAMNKANLRKITADEAKRSENFYKTFKNVAYQGEEKCNKWSIISAGIFSSHALLSR